MLIIGLTGSIGMGKSTAARLFREAGIPVHDADAAVHALYAGAAVDPIEEAFPGVARNGVIDRPALAQRVLGNPGALRRLEHIVHPLVSADRKAFTERAHAQGARMAVLDVPLLFETGSERFCQMICVVSAPFDVQKRRVLARDGMTEAKFVAILDKQLPDDRKRKKAHFIIDSSRGIEAAKRQIEGIIRSVAGMTGRMIA